nr:MAG TPA: hypothetical protein [Crassvirales sp.]
MLCLLGDLNIDVCVLHGTHTPSFELEYATPSKCTKSEGNGI